jgi:lipoprotein-anchoring transpeptidase ErfK/SrfK
VLSGSLPTNGYHSHTPVVVVVDKGSHSTYVLQLQDKKIVRVLTVSNAVGSGDTPTPPGRYTVAQMKKYPIWTPPKSIDPKQKPVPPFNQTHKNPLGVAAIYLNKFGILLHGTNEPQMIRKSASHGCIRHSNTDIQQLYGMIHTGDVVYIVNKFRGKVLNESDFVRSSRRS